MENLCLGYQVRLEVTDPARQIKARMENRQQDHSIADSIANEKVFARAIEKQPRGKIGLLAEQVGKSLDAS